MKTKDHGGVVDLSQDASAMISSIFTDEEFLLLLSLLGLGLKQSKLKESRDENDVIFLKTAWSTLAKLVIFCPKHLEEVTNLALKQLGISPKENR